MNTDVMFSSKTDLWETPQDFFDNLDDLFHFTLDACATSENTKCEHYYTPEQDGLSQQWSGVTRRMGARLESGLKKPIIRRKKGRQL